MNILFLIWIRTNFIRDCLAQNLHRDIINNVREEDSMIIQSQRQITRPATTAHLAQTMSLMGLSAAELQQKIEAALASNPALELVEKRTCPICHRPLASSEPCQIGRAHV